MTLEEAIKYVVWVKKSEKRSDFTVKDYEKQIGALARFLRRKNVQAVEDVTAEHVRMFLTETAKRGVSETTLNIKKRYIKAFFNLMVDDGFIVRNPATGVKIRKEELDTVQPIPDEILHKLLKQPDQRKFTGKRDYVCMLVMLDTGIRPSELFGMNVEDWQDLNIIVRKEVAKGRKPRILPLSPGVMRELYKYERMRQGWGGRILFPSQEGNRLKTNGFNQALKKYAEKGGINPAIVRPYAFRHTFALNYLKNGDPYTLQKLLGHEDMEMTRRYVQLSQQDVEELRKNVTLGEKYITLKKKRRR